MTTPAQTRVLIVDDEANVARTLALGLQKLGRGYSFDTAKSSDKALELLDENDYTLILTDYKMPGMNGLDLAIRVNEIAPETRVLMMTAHGTAQLRQSVDAQELDGYIEKPFSIDKIRAIVRDAAQQTRVAQEPPEDVMQAVFQSTRAHLRTLRSSTRARCVLLLSTSGYLFDVVGDTAGLDAAKVSALVAANFLAAAELADLFSNDSEFKSVNHEGNDYNIYSYGINDDVIIAVVFGDNCKPGAIWYYTKKTVKDLEPLLDDIPAPRFVEDDFEQSFDAGFDDLLDATSTDIDTTDHPADTGDEFEASRGRNVTGEVDRSDMAEDAGNERDRSDETLSYEEAVDAGILPSEWADTNGSG